jgi:hypothetical protein
MMIEHPNTYLFRIVPESYQGGKHFLNLIKVASIVMMLI